MDINNIPNLLPSDFDSLPPKFTPTERWVRQMGLVSQIYEMFKDVDVIFLQAPTGTGKTVIGKTSGMLLGGQYLHLSATKQLQDQFGEDFTDAKVVKGRSNYLTDSGILDEWGKVKKHGRSEVTCADCTYNIEDGCNWCYGYQTCPYVIAKTRAQSARLASLNYAYFLTDVGKGQGNFGGRRLVIADECDLIEREMLNQVEIVISGRKQAAMGLSSPAFVYGGKTTEKVWKKWVNNEAIPAAIEYMDLLPNPHDTNNIKDIKEYQATHRLLDKLMMLDKELGDGGWVFDGYSKDPQPSDPIIFRPTRVDKWGKDVLWDHGEKFLLMSATILSADMMADELGLDKQWGLLDIDSDFPIANRPIHYVPIADMSYKATQASNRGNWNEMARGIGKTVEKLHQGQRVLVHCVSYDLVGYLAANLNISTHNVVSYFSSGEKEAALKQYTRHPSSVLLAASMDRGVDLPEDLCRVQIVAKIPFPNTSDKRTNARMYGDGGRNWYRLQTIRTLIQMTGRGVRSADDWCVTYIFDEQFRTNLWKSEYLFPKWWKEALNWKMNKARLGL